MAAPKYSHTYRVYYEDTDLGGVVYYANYLKFMERCRTDWLWHMGVDQQQLRTERNLQFVVVHVSVDYRRPAVLHDEILVTAELTRLAGATIKFKQTVMRGDEQLIDATTQVACLDASTLRPRPIPKDLFAEWRNAE